ncbi:hypothetical protein OIN60_22140 [Paenibacillus sp. P96]|uniref:Uncharacterized protein n=1 Tax=Paenibacillus zeirhizosphaerae TaxID=2987519 RepID=A0ABT9FXK3_9BACL|nr:hypothetical protein [Paenibacillus sp. P96]MDP4099420.1 hypothetical protein [Paenibacillus sp. P96]
MSQASIPNITPTITVRREDAINLVLISIGMEELGLSHIINAEAEKLQYVLGTLPGLPPSFKPTFADLMTINCSIRETLQEVYKKEFALANKLDILSCAIEDEDNNCCC